MTPLQCIVWDDQDPEIFRRVFEQIATLRPDLSVRFLSHIPAGALWRLHLNHALTRTSSKIFMFYLLS